MMKRFSLFGLLLCLLLPVCALADASSDFNFLDEWVGNTVSDAYFTVFFQKDDKFAPEDSQCMVILNRESESCTVDVYGRYGVETYDIADVGKGYYILYRYNDNDELYTVLVKKSEKSDEWLAYRNTSVARLFLTEKKVIFENGKGAFDYAVRDSNFYLFNENDYMKLPFSPLSDTAFLLELKDTTSSENFLMLMVRSSAFEQ